MFIFRNFKHIFESEEAYFGLDEGLVFRAKKPAFDPRILPRKSLQFDPTSTIVEVDREALLELRRKYDVEVWDSGDASCTVFPGLGMVTEKRKFPFTTTKKRKNKRKSWEPKLPKIKF